MSATRLILMAWLAAPAACLAAAEAEVTDQFGVTIIRGHLAAPAVAAPDQVELLAPVFAVDHDRFSSWRSITELRREAMQHVAPRSGPHRVRVLPPWTYTPQDQTYRPKTDWIYHPLVGDYAPVPTRWYSAKENWTYHPKRFRHWL